MHFFLCSLHDILQVYKCHFWNGEIKAVKIVKMEPQYTHTQEVILIMVMCIKDASFLNSQMLRRHNICATFKNVSVYIVRPKMFPWGKSKGHDDIISLGNYLLISKQSS